MLLSRNSDTGDLMPPLSKLLRDRAKTLAAQIDNPTGIPFGTSSQTIDVGSDLGVVRDRALGNDCSPLDVEGQTRDFSWFPSRC
jgi:hypothetical protein